MSYTYSFEIGEAEQVRGCRTVVNRRWSMRLVYAGIGLCFVIVTGLYLRDRWRGEFGSERFFVAVYGGVVAGLAVSYLTPRSTVRNLRKKNRAATGMQTYVLDDEGFHGSAPGAATSFEWANIVEVFETKEFLFFYIAAAWAVLLPKRVVPAADVARLRVDLVRWTAGKAHLMTE